MVLKYKKLTETAHTPVRGSEKAAGLDLYTDNDFAVRIEPHGFADFRTGLSFEIPDGYFGAIYPRSGLSTKQHLRPSNCVGVIDCDYRGEVMVQLTNDSNEPQYVSAFSRVAQMIIQKYEDHDLEETEELSETERGNNGFGSTGVK